MFMNRAPLCIVASNIYVHVVFAALLIVVKNPIIQVASSSAADALEAARFGSLPPIVFAPGGRLHGVESVARESNPSGDDESSCACIALRCGSGDGEFAIISGIGAISPFLHRDEAYSTISSDNEETTNGYIPLVIDYHEAPHDAPLAPISIVSRNVVVGVGGKGNDSAVLLRRASEVSLSMYKSNNGGVEWFMSNSLEGISANSHGNPIGGAARVEVKALVRNIADLAQGSTQSLGGKSGRMLSSALLAIGMEKDRINGKTISIWRVDPTGQFWNLDGGAVGRAAPNIDAELIDKVRIWKKSGTQQTPAHEPKLIITNDDVKAYLSSLRVEEALSVANSCLVDGILSSVNRRNHDLHSDRALDNSQLEKGLRKRLKSAIIRSRSFDDISNRCIEFVRG